MNSFSIVKADQMWNAFSDFDCTILGDSLLNPVGTKTRMLFDKINTFEVFHLSRRGVGLAVRNLIQVLLCSDELRPVPKN